MIPNKKELFKNLSNTQKSMLLSFLKNFVKKKKMEDENILLEKFIEEQQYYIDINQPYFCFIEEYIEDEKFVKEIKFVIKNILFEQKQKISNKPFIEKQKEIAKKFRKKVQEYKMSKEPPTKKQIYFYKHLCKQKNIQHKDPTNLSKLDLRNLINELTQT